MRKLFETTMKDVKRLEPEQLVQLLECLLENELALHGAPASALDLSNDINHKDGGEDASVRLPLGVTSLGRLPAQVTLFQSKAGKLTKSKAVSELFEAKARNKNKKGNKKATKQSQNTETRLLKSRIESTFSEGGTYILFYGQTCVKDTKVEWADAMLAAVAPIHPNANIVIFDASDIKRWANKHFSAILLVGEFLGKNLGGFGTWGHLNRISEHRIPFQKSQMFEQHSSLIRGICAQKRSVQRLVGLPGLGKTRLVLETFRPPERLQDDVNQALLSASMAYIDATNISNVVERVETIMRSGDSGIIVVDNCQIIEHEQLASVVRSEGSNLSLLTIDYHVADENANILRMKESSNSTIEAMVIATLPGLDRASIEAIVRYANGYPKIVSLLERTDLEQDALLKPLTQQTLIDRLVWGRRPKDDIGRELIECSALFANFGYQDEVEHEMAYIAENVCSPSIPLDDFYRRSRFFMDRGILESIGAFLRVSPLPLAISLTESWWNSTVKSRQTRLLENSQMPERLRSCFLNQFSQLGDNERKQEMVRRLTTPDAPFGRAEVLFTRNGASVFRSFVEVAPQRTMEVLQRLLSPLTIEELRDVREARRDIVYSLELLAFHEQHFAEAATLLLRLAVAENETWGNNATGQFLQLFQPLLSGTEAPPELRLHVLQQHLQSENLETRLLVIQALGRVIRNDGFGRSGDAGNQGGKILKDWTPTTYRELFDYFEGATALLSGKAQESDAEGDLARKQFVDGIRHLARYGRIEAIVNATRKIYEARRELWLDAVHALRDSKKYELKDAPAEFVVPIDELIEQLAPRDLAERVYSIVTRPDFGNFKEAENGEMVNLSAVAARALADEVAGTPGSLPALLPFVSFGDQREAFAFGSRIGEVLPNVDVLIRTAWSLSSDDETKSFNPSFVAGLVSALRERSPMLASTVLRDLAATDAHLDSLAWLVAATNPVEDDIRLIIPKVLTGAIDAKQMLPFSYGRTLANLDPRFVVNTFEQIASLGLEAAAVAFFAVWMFCSADPEKWKICSPALRRVTLRPDILNMPEQTQITRHALERTLIRLLSDSQDVELALHITKSLILGTKESGTDFVTDETNRNLITAIAEHYPDDSWPLIREALTDENILFRMRFMALLEKRAHADFKRSTMLLSFGTCALTTWADENPDVAATLLARHLPLFEFVDGQEEICRALQEVVERHSDTPGVLGELEANLHSYGYVGSAIPVLAERIDFIKSLSCSKGTKLRNWSHRMLSSFEDQLRKERMRNDERKVGIFRAPT